MKRRFLRKNRFKVQILFLSLLVLYLIYWGMYLGKYVLTNCNDKKLKKVLETITYTESDTKKEITLLETYSNQRMLSDSMKGSLYKSLAELSYMTGDDMLYNKNIATALYYLEKEKDAQSVVYLTNKYMGRLYANGCYEEAEKLLENLSMKYDMSKLSLEMQASYYLSRADLAQMLKHSDEEFMKSAQSAIILMDDTNEKQLNQAKYDLLNIRKAIMNGKWQDAEGILNLYSEDDAFGYDADQVYVICDFRIPYEEMNAKIALYKEDMESARLHLNNYFELCEQFRFRTMELNLLQYANEQPVLKKSKQYDTYEALEKTVIKRNLSEITGEYAQVLLTDLSNTKHNLELADKSNSQRQGVIFALLIILTILITILFFLSLFVDYLKRDALTKLDNRKKYEQLRSECDKKKIPYGLLMVDIDDFKKVNDTLGHQKGDVVLSGIAGILSSYTGRGIEAFRYGGEEMCVMFLQVPEKRIYEIAEEIRMKIEKTRFVDEMTITISGGIAMSEQGENVFVKADQKLYEAKANGKNQICY